MASRMLHAWLHPRRRSRFTDLAATAADVGPAPAQQLKARSADNDEQTRPRAVCVAVQGSTAKNC